jgi:hypothetical protein
VLNRLHASVWAAGRFPVLSLRWIRGLVLRFGIRVVIPILGHFIPRLGHKERILVFHLVFPVVFPVVFLLLLLLLIFLIRKLHLLVDILSVDLDPVYRPSTWTARSRE